MSSNSLGKAAAGVWKWPILIILIVGALAAGWLIVREQLNIAGGIHSYEDCARADNPITGSYPEQCTANGKTYINSNNLTK